MKHDRHECLSYMLTTRNAMTTGLEEDLKPGDRSGSGDGGGGGDLPATLNFPAAAAADSAATLPVGQQLHCG